MKQTVLVLLFIFSNYSLSFSLVDNTITVTSEESLESLFEKNYNQNKIADSCWDNFLKLNQDLNDNSSIVIGTIIYLPAHDSCIKVSEKSVYVPQVELENEELKDPVATKSNFLKFKESYNLGLELSYSYYALKGTNSSNGSSLQLLSKSAYSLKLLNEFKFESWQTEINFHYEKIEFKELPTAQILGNDFSKSRIEVLISRELSKKFNLGLYQEFGEALLHESSGPNLKLIKTQKWMGALYLNYSIFKGESTLVELKGIVGHSLITADENRDTSGGINYLAKVDISKSIKDLSLNVGVFHRVEKEENGIYHQVLNNSGISFGVKLDF
jgi:hypothetical protein